MAMTITTHTHNTDYAKDVKRLLKTLKPNAPLRCTLMDEKTNYQYVVQ
jgi:hypothetical protein